MSTPKRNQSTVNAAAGIGVVVVALFIGKALYKIGKRVPVEDVAKSVTKLDGGADNVLHATPQTGELPTSIARDVVMETGEIVIEGTVENQKE